MIVNMLRGTGPRGLIGFSRKGIIRPLILKTKQELKDYAIEHNLEWREDSTNSDESYLRNYVRANFLPKLDDKRGELLDLRVKTIELVSEIDELTKKLLVSCMKKGELVRARFVVLPLVVQYELIAMWLRLSNITFDAQTIDRLTLAVKASLPAKKIDIDKNAKFEIGKQTISLKVSSGPV
jgi:tRNA(Ile)-lysidine synthase